jgi:hypothetical protein
MKELGLLVFVYRSNDGDCTNGGVTSRFDKFILVGKGVDPVFGSSEETPILYLVRRKRFEDMIAVPILPKNEDGWTGMFGGNFIYTSDGRFPSGQPIKVHDRFE